MSNPNSSAESKATHTPGPWEIGDLDRNEQRQVIGVDGQLVSVCAHGSVQSLVPVMEANARLIAVSPKMLDALRAFCGDYESCRQTRPFHSGLEAAYRHALTVIAEAEGATA